MLLSQVENEARSRKISLILASISSENKESQVFHVKNGFRECGRFHKAGLKFNIPFDLVWMEKELV
jgi:L-amino acid N-acyltransferase YncA